MSLDEVGSPASRAAGAGTDEGELDHWLSDPDPVRAPAIAARAAASARWDVVEEAWMVLNERVSAIPIGALEVFRDLPAAARMERPLLTWAAAAANSVLSPSPAKEGEAGLEKLLLDSAMLHSGWATRPDTDAAVNAGSFRMLGERRLPSSRPGQSLEAAWRTKRAVDDLIDSRSREGRGPGHRPQAIFRAFSARLALARADLPNALSEARWATLLTDWDPVAVLARGVERLASSLLAGDAGPADAASTLIDDDLGVRGLRGMGEAFSILAEANDALRALDRARFEQALSMVTAEAAALAGVWSVRASLRGFGDALWDDPGAGVHRLFTAIAGGSLMGREQDEPLGRILLGRARLLLLTKAGAFASVAELLDQLPEAIQILPRARMHLWAGNPAQAIDLAEAGFYDARLLMADRARLTLVRVGAAIMDGSCTEKLKEEAVAELRVMVAEENFVQLAVLPVPVRRELVELARPELSDHAGFALMLERLGGLNDVDDESGSRPFRLTERERVLLPLLATDEPVPAIARRLHVSVNTLRKQVATLREKFGAESRAELVRRARHHGVLG